MASIWGLANRHSLIDFPIRHACTSNNGIEYTKLRSKVLTISFTSLRGHILRHTCEYHNWWSSSKFEGFVSILHILGFFALLLPLMFYGPHQQAAEVFSTFVNGGGWPTQGLSYMIGLVGSVFAFGDMSDVSSFYNNDKPLIDV